MGADMLAATLLGQKGVPLDFDAGRQAAREFKKDDVTETQLEELYEEWESDGLTDYDQWDPRITLEKVVDRLEEALNGRGVTFHTYGNLEIWIAGGMSWGDTEDECKPMWAISGFPKILRAVGFLAPEDVEFTIIKEHA